MKVNFVAKVKQQPQVEIGDVLKLQDSELRMVVELDGEVGTINPRNGRYGATAPTINKLLAIYQNYEVFKLRDITLEEK